MEVIDLNLTADKFIEHHSSFTTGEFAEALRNEVPGIGRSTIYNILKKKCDSGIISRAGRGRFSRSAGKEYFYELSETAKNIVALIQASYPLVDFQIWEFYQMNEFVNHLLAKNTIFVDVENMLDESVFHLLFDRYPHVRHLANTGRHLWKSFSSICLDGDSPVPSFHAPNTVQSMKIPFRNTTSTREGCFGTPAAGVLKRLYGISSGKRPPSYWRIQNDRQKSL